MEIGMSSQPFTINSQIIRAGAGAGKTTRLIQTVLKTAENYYQANGRYPKIIVTTFTRKATQEIKERLLSQVVESGGPLLDYVRSSGLTVTTMHGLIDRYLRSWSSILDLNQDFKLADDADSTKKKRHILFESLYQDKNLQSLLNELTFEEIQDYCRQYEEEFNINNEFLKATDQEKEYQSLLKNLILQTIAVAKHASSVSDQNWISFSSSLNNLVNKFKQDCFYNLKPEFEKHLEVLSKPRKKPKNDLFEDSFHDECKQVIEAWNDFLGFEFKKDNWLKQESIYAQFSKLIFIFLEKLKSNKLQNNWLEMSDLEKMGLNLVLKPELKDKFSKAYDFWLIDEYQDTSPVQETILKQLINGSPSYVVGDPQQSIYLFRGAKSQVFENKWNESLANHVQAEESLINYRSYKNVLNFINYVFSSQRQTFQPMAWGKNETQINEPVRISLNSDSISEEKWIVSELIQLRQKNSDLSRVTFLLRSNIQILQWKTVLLSHGFPVVAKLAQGFYESRAVKDLIIILSALTNPWQKNNLVFLMHIPVFQFNQQQIAQILQQESVEKNIWLILKSSQLTNKFKFFVEARESISKQGIFHSFVDLLININFFEFHRSQEGNVWKFLYELNQQLQTPDFCLSDYLQEMLEKKTQKKSAEMPQSDEQGSINLMTVHGSKGLQFPVVFIPEIHKKPKLSHFETFFYDEEIQKWFFRTLDTSEQKKTGTIFDKKVLKKQKELEKLENERLFYVALTRTQECLYLSSSGKSQSESWQSLLNINLETGVHQEHETCYEVCSDLKHDEVQYSAIEDQSFEKAELKPLNIPFVAHQRQSVTELATESILKIYPEQKSISNLQAIARGVKAHRLFELMNGKNGDQIKELILKWFPDEIHEVTQALQYLFQLNEPPVTKLVQDGFRESHVAYLQNENLVEGQIDLWGIVDDTLWVIDYKTGSSENLEKGFSQLQHYAYALALNNSLKFSKTKLVLVFPFQGKVSVREYLK